MSMTTTTVAAIAAGSLALVFAVVAVLLLRKQKAKCPICGTKLPRGGARCRVCEEKQQAERQRESEEEPASVETAPVELICVQGPLAEKRFPIRAQGLTIGRHPDNDIVLGEELMVSRFHAMIAVENGQYVLYDRDSANGTWVNDQRVFRHLLTPGDRIQIWQSRFAFASIDAPVPSTPPGQAVAPTVHITGDLFAGYRLGPLIGRGGMSEVFRASDPNGKIVAIKILQQTDPYLVAKFVQEGNQIGPLLRDHPNVVYVYEFGQSPDNRLYIVMELVDAPSLRRLMRKPWSEPEIVNVVGQVCSALAFAHRNKVVHRDIKPENILLSTDGEVKVLDFGIAKLTSASTVTRDKIVGTPEYISPEQARGETVCPASDVYSLGIVLYEILAGSVPFRRPQDDNPYRSAMEVIRQHLKERPEPLKKRNPDLDVSPNLERVTMRALKKSASARYETAKEMGEALGYQELHYIPPSVAKPATASLLVLKGPKQGQRIALSDQDLVLGRAVLDPSNVTISRQHASIKFQGGKYWLQDNSKNGTWLDNRRIHGEVPLDTGAVIMIGGNMLRLERDES